MYGYIGEKKLLPKSLLYVACYTKSEKSMGGNKRKNVCKCYEVNSYLKWRSEKNRKSKLKISTNERTGAAASVFPIYSDTGVSMNTARERRERRMRKDFWMTIERTLDESAGHEERLGVLLGGVKPVLYAFEMIQDKYEISMLRDTPEQLFRDVLLALRQQHPQFTMEDFARAFEHSKTHMNNMISVEPSSRARCRIYPSQYEKLLAIFSHPYDFVQPSMPNRKELP